MPRPRFFPNKMPDYIAGQDIDINKSTWHEQITSLITVIIDAAPSSSTDGGLYVGTAGIAYMLYYASIYDPFFESRERYLQMAKALFDRDLKAIDKSKPSKADAVSFILGPSGVYAVGAFLGSILKNEALVSENVQRFQSVAKECLKPKFLSCGSDELFVGRAGYICGALALEKKLGVKVCNHVIGSNVLSIVYGPLSSIIRFIILCISISFIILDELLWSVWGGGHGRFGQNGSHVLYCLRPSLLIHQMCWL